MLLGAYALIYYTHACAHTQNTISTNCSCSYLCSSIIGGIISDKLQRRKALVITAGMQTAYQTISICVLFIDTRSGCDGNRRRISSWTTLFCSGCSYFIIVWYMSQCIAANIGNNYICQNGAEIIKY